MIVLDTHSWIWWLDDSTRLSDRARETIGSATTIVVSSISVWEVALLVKRGRMRLDKPTAVWINSAFGSDSRMREIPLDGAIALRATDLEDRGFVRDPADRFIFATAEHFDAPIVTRDARMHEFDSARAFW